MSKKSDAAPSSVPLPVDFPLPPQRRARLTLELEADSPDELRRAMARALARIGAGCDAWQEDLEHSGGDARLLIEEDDRLVLGGAEFLEARSRWRERRAALQPKPAAS